MSFNNRRWIFLDAANLSAVNFDQVLETSADTLRYSVDGSMFFVKYNVHIWTEQDQTNAESVPSLSGEEVILPDHSIGDVLGRPECFELALEIDGKVEYTHSEVLEYLATEAWSAPLTGLEN